MALVFARWALLALFGDSSRNRCEKETYAKIFDGRMCSPLEDTDEDIVMNLASRPRDPSACRLACADDDECLYYMWNGDTTSCVLYSDCKRSVNIGDETAVTYRKVRSEKTKLILANEELEGNGIDAAFATADELVSRGSHLAFYFSAHWCKVCNEFIDKLAAAQRSANRAEKRLEVIYVSKDNDEDNSDEQFSEMPESWWRIPFTNKILSDSLAEQFAIVMIPAVVIVSPHFVMLSNSARQDVDRDSRAESFPWASQDVVLDNTCGLPTTTKTGKGKAARVQKAPPSAPAAAGTAEVSAGGDISVAAGDSSGSTAHGEPASASLGSTPAFDAIEDQAFSPGGAGDEGIMFDMR